MIRMRGKTPVCIVVDFLGFIFCCAQQKLNKTQQYIQQREFQEEAKEKQFEKK